MLRPADGVADRGGLLPTRRSREHVGDFEESLARNAAHPLHHLRRAAGEVALEHLKDAAGMLQRAVLPSFVQPALRIVFTLLHVPAGDEAAQIFRILEIRAEYGRR